MSVPVIFLGPSLPAEEARAALDCRILPPARQGDLYRAVRQHKPAAIGLIDGAFHGVPAVWHPEILWAMSEGTRVFGGASMGALRAAELAPFCMRGVGRVYEAYLSGHWSGYDGAFEDDDEVAVIHAPEALGYRPLSVAMVDLRDTLLAAERASLIGRAARDRLTAVMKALPFAGRSYERLAEEARTHLPGATADPLAGFLRHGTVPRKKLDALAVLRTIAAEGARPAPTPDFRFVSTLVWQRFVEDEEARGLLPEEAVMALVLEELRLDPAAFRAALDAAAPGDAAANDRFQLDRWRVAKGLWSRASLDSWGTANQLAPASLADLLARDAALDAVPLSPRVIARLMRHLRLNGRFVPLLDRARRKQAFMERERLEANPVSISVALEWYQQSRIGCGGPDVVAVILARQRWGNREQLEAAVWKEHCFVHSQDPS